MATRRRVAGAWYAKKTRPHEAVVSTVDRLIAEKRRDELALWRDLFLAGRPQSTSTSQSGVPRPGMRARVNVVRNAVETLVARIGKNQPRPWIVTVGGDWQLQRKAKKMGRYIDGDWERLGADRMRRDMLRDALIYGTGVIKVFGDPEVTGQVQWARVWCGDVFTHKREERAGHVRTMYQIAFVDREVAKNRWPEHKLEIQELGPPDAKLLRDSGAEHDDDLILVYEAWRLPSGRNKKGEPIGGRHVVCIESATLEDDDWERDHFPFAMLAATDDPESMWGVGYPERMAGAQAEQNALAELASDVARLMTPKYVLQNGSQLTPQTTSNDIEFWEVTGGALELVSAENNILAIMQAAAIQRSSTYAIEGISEQSAEGTSPDNLDSGKAKLVHRDIESERHVELGKRSEEVTVRLCKLHIAELEELAEDGGADLVAYSGKAMLEELHYDDVRLGDDPCHVRVYPVSALSNTPQGKLAQLNEMLSNGVINVAEWRELYDMPDMDRSNDLAFAGRELSRKLVEEALDGKEVAATRACDLPFLIDQAWKEHALAQLQGATTIDLEPLRNLAGHAQAVLDQQQAALAPPPAAAGPMPMPPMPPAAAPPPVPPMGIQGVVQ